MKSVGLMCIFVSCSLAGFWYAGICEKRLRLLQEGIYVLKRFQHEIDGAASMAEAAKILERTAKTPYRSFFYQLYTTIEEAKGGSLEEIWKMSSEELRHSSLREEDVESWIRLGNQMDSMDRQTQILSLERLRKEWMDICDEWKIEWRKKQNLYQALGMIGGGILCILLW
ncbi:MAG: stage III sporulation protein AB [Lachnospiraceae bacterium]